MTRPTDPTDNAVPSAWSVAAIGLARLVALLDAAHPSRSALDTAPSSLLHALIGHAAKAPLGFSNLLCAAEILDRGLTEVVIPGDGIAATTLRDEVATTWRPEVVLAWGEGARDRCGRAASRTGPTCAATRCVRRRSPMSTRWPPPWRGPPRDGETAGGRRSARSAPARSASAGTTGPPRLRGSARRKRGCGRMVLAGAVALVVLLVLAAILAWLARGPTPSPVPPTLPPGEAPFEVIKAFAPEVAWNRPVSEFGPSTRYASYADRLWKYGNFGGWTDPARRGRFEIEFRNYSVPIYDARTATGSRKAYFTSWGYPPSPGASIAIPWNDSWQAAPGNDAILLVLNPTTGETWSVWALQSNGSNCINANNLAHGFSIGGDLCVGGLWKLMNEDGSVGDYRTWNGVQSERGMGLPKLALVTTPYEVRSGKIPHALEMTVFNTMFGPPCSAAAATTSAAGNTCGIYLPPATRIEWEQKATTNCGANNQPSTPAYRRKTVPEGMRFALRVTDAEIEQWLDRRGYRGPKRSTARIFAVAMRDYGWIIGETGCYSTAIEVDGMVNPDAAAIWKSLGIEDTPDAANLLDGLVTRERIYVVAPPEPVAGAKGPNPGLGAPG
ncbi:MAG: hypothetical protein R2698_00200 [Microthrixaceae bacterium]